MKTLTLFLPYLIFLGCKPHKDFRIDFEKHKFDSVVINNLSNYDTLRQIILENYDSFYLINNNFEFKYLYNFDSTVHIGGYNNDDVPEKIRKKTNQLFQKIGKANILGFTFHRDTTLEFFIRNVHSTKYYLDVRERMIWFPNINNKEKVEFPFKDTILNEKWQYQIWYDKRIGW